MKTTSSNVITLVVDHKTIETMKSFYQDHFIESKQPFVEFVAKYEETTITCYKSMKVVFQGSNAFKEAKIWSKNIKEDIRDISNGVFTLGHIGSDEVGTGDLFGPIIVVACYVKSDQIKLLKDLGVKDSKLMKDPEITILAKKLIKILTFSQLHLTNQKYNQLIQNGFNMNKIKAFLHNQALLNLKQKVQAKNVPIILDQFCSEEKYYQYLTNQKDVVTKIIFITKAESKALAVAAASIIARYSFITKLDALGKKFGVTLPKGAGSKVDDFANELIKKISDTDFASITKMNFKNLERISLLDSE